MYLRHQAQLLLPLIICLYLVDLLIFTSFLPALNKNMGQPSLATHPPKLNSSFAAGGRFTGNQNVLKCTKPYPKWSGT